MGSNNLPSATTESRTVPQVHPTFQRLIFMESHLTVEQGHVFGVVQSRSIIRPNVLAFLLVKCFFVF